MRKIVFALIMTLAFLTTSVIAESNDELSLDQINKIVITKKEINLIWQIPGMKEQVKPDMDEDAVTLLLKEKYNTDINKLFALTVKVYTILSYVDAGYSDADIIQEIREAGEGIIASPSEIKLVRDNKDALMKVLNEI